MTFHMNDDFACSPSEVAKDSFEDYSSSESESGSELEDIVDEIDYYIEANYGL